MPLITQEKLMFQLVMWSYHDLKQLDIVFAPCNQFKPFPGIITKINYFDGTCNIKFIGYRSSARVFLNTLELFNQETISKYEKLYYNTTDSQEKAILRTIKKAIPMYVKKSKKEENRSLQQIILPDSNNKDITKQRKGANKKKFKPSYEQSSNEKYNNSSQSSKKQTRSRQSKKHRQRSLEQQKSLSKNKKIKHKTQEKANINRNKVYYEQKPKSMNVSRQTTNSKLSEHNKYSRIINEPQSPKKQPVRHNFSSTYLKKLQQKLKQQKFHHKNTQLSSSYGSSKEKTFQNKNQSSEKDSSIKKIKMAELLKKKHHKKISLTNSSQINEERRQTFFQKQWRRYQQKLSLKNARKSQSKHSQQKDLSKSTGKVNKNRQKYNDKKLKKRIKKVEIHGSQLKKTSKPQRIIHQEKVVKKVNYLHSAINRQQYEKQEEQEKQQQGKQEQYEYFFDQFNKNQFISDYKQPQIITNAIKAQMQQTTKIKIQQTTKMNIQIDQKHQQEEQLNLVKKQQGIIIQKQVIKDKKKKKIIKKSKNEKKDKKKKRDRRKKQFRRSKHNDQIKIENNEVKWQHQQTKLIQHDKDKIKKQQEISNDNIQNGYEYKSQYLSFQDYQNQVKYLHIHKNLRSRSQYFQEDSEDSFMRVDKDLNVAYYYNYEELDCSYDELSIQEGNYAKLFNTLPYRMTMLQNYNGPHILERFTNSIIILINYLKQKPRNGMKIIKKCPLTMKNKQILLAVTQCQRITFKHMIQNETIFKIFQFITTYETCNYQSLKTICKIEYMKLRSYMNLQCLKFQKWSQQQKQALRDYHRYADMFNFYKQRIFT